MCLYCDGYDVIDARRTVDLAIGTHGWAVSGVTPNPGDRAGPTWAYTIGLHENFGVTELVAVDLDVGPAAELLNHTATVLTGGDPADLSFDGIRLGPIHPDHLDGGLVGGWATHYGRDPHDVTFTQVFPPEHWFCGGHAAGSTPLDRPGSLRTARAPNRAERRSARRRHHRR